MEGLQQIVNASLDISNAMPYNQYYFVPHNSTGIFTGRNDVLRKLHLYGLGGSGKTQTCTMFAEFHRERLVVQYRHSYEVVAVRLTLFPRFWGIFWIDASTPMTIQQGFRYIAQQCGLDAD